MTEPRTEAGRRLLDRWFSLVGGVSAVRDAILAIEAEAAAGPRGTFYVDATAWSHRTEPDDHHAPVIENKWARDSEEHPGTDVFMRCASCGNAVACREAAAGPRDKHERCGFTLECPCWTAGASVGPLRKASE